MDQPTRTTPVGPRALHSWRQSWKWPSVIISTAMPGTRYSTAGASRDASPDVAQASRLVGIELNPGPGDSTPPSLDPDDGEIVKLCLQSLTNGSPRSQSLGCRSAIEPAAACSTRCGTAGNIRPCWTRQEQPKPTERAPKKRSNLAVQRADDASESSSIAVDLKRPRICATPPLLASSVTMHVLSGQPRAHLPCPLVTSTHASASTVDSIRGSPSGSTHPSSSRAGN